MKAARNKSSRTRILNKTVSRFSSETLRPEDSAPAQPSAKRKRTDQPRTLNPEKPSFKGKGEIRTFPDELKLRAGDHGSVPAGSAQGVPQVEIKGYWIVLRATWRNKDFNEDKSP